MSKTIGFVGTGAMGSRMIVRLIEDKNKVTVYNRNSEATKPLAKKGVMLVNSIQDLVKTTDFIVISVPDDQALRDVIKQATAVDCKGKTFISVSTVSPDVAVELSEEVKEAKAYFIDAPVSGSAPQVEAAQLIIFVGGDEAKYKEAKPIFSSFSKATYFMGPAGNGSRMKLVVNTLLGLGVQALAESLTLGERMGLSKDKLVEVISDTVVVSPSQKIKMQNALDNNYEVAFSLSNMYKDLGLILDQAQKTYTPMPATAASRQVYATGMSQKLDKDFSVIIKLLEEGGQA